MCGTRSQSATRYLMQALASSPYGSTINSGELDLSELTYSIRSRHPRRTGQPMMPASGHRLSVDATGDSLRARPP